MELWIAIGAGVVQGLITWGAVRADLRYLRRDIDHAHRRLDKAGAPEQWERA